MWAGGGPPRQEVRALPVVGAGVFRTADVPHQIFPHIILSPGPILATADQGCVVPQNLKEVFASKIPIWQKEIKEVKTLYGDKILGTCTVEQAYGGMRSVKSMVYETSLLDPVEVLHPPHHLSGRISCAPCRLSRFIPQRRCVHSPKTLLTISLLRRASASAASPFPSAKSSCPRLK